MTGSQLEQLRQTMADLYDAQGGFLDFEQAAWLDKQRSGLFALAFSTMAEARKAGKPIDLLPIMRMIAEMANVSDALFFGTALRAAMDGDSTASAYLDQVYADADQADATASA
jgi:hypothetical protein